MVCAAFAVPVIGSFKHTGDAIGLASNQYDAPVEAGGEAGDLVLPAELINPERLETFYRPA